VTREDVARLPVAASWLYVPTDRVLHSPLAEFTVSADSRAAVPLLTYLGPSHRGNKRSRLRIVNDNSRAGRSPCRCPTFGADFNSFVQRCEGVDERAVHLVDGGNRDRLRFCLAIGQIRRSRGRGAVEARLRRGVAYWG
jgi:hypothetical protein